MPEQAVTPPQALLAQWQNIAAAEAQRKTVQISLTLQQQVLTRKKLKLELTPDERKILEETAPEYQEFNREYQQSRPKSARQQRLQEILTTTQQYLAFLQEQEALSHAQAEQQLLDTMQDFLKWLKLQVCLQTLPQPVADDHLQHYPTLRKIFNRLDSIQKHVHSRRALYALFFILGLIPDSVSSVVFGKSSILALVPSIPMGALVAILIVFTVLNALLYASFEAWLLKKFLMPPPSTDHNTALPPKHTQLDIALLQIRTAKYIDHYFAHFTAQHYQKHSNYPAAATKLSGAIMQHIEELNTRPYLQKYRERWATAIFRNIVALYGAMMVGSGSYFMAHELLTTVPLALFAISTVIVAVISIMVISQLVMYLAMRGSSVMGVMNPDLLIFKKIRERLGKFNYGNYYGALLTPSYNNIINTSLPHQHTSNEHVLQPCQSRCSYPAIA